jgi:hypothetical protein
MFVSLIFWLIGTLSVTSDTTTNMQWSTTTAS